MITAKAIRDLIRTQPFKPFRIVMSSGESYDVVNHDAALVGMNLDPDGFAEFFHRCSILHIATISDQTPTPSRKRRNGRKAK